MITDADRRQLHDDLLQVLGPRSTATMMELLPPSGWDDVARSSDLAAVRAELRGEMAELRGEMAELRGEMAELRSELRGEIAELRGEVHAQLPKLIAANIASMVGVAGLVLAAGAVL